MLQSNLMNLILKRSLQKIVGPSLHARNRESSFSKLATLAENTPPALCAMFMARQSNCHQSEKQTKFKKIPTSMCELN
jgi:hypothetical protein